MSDWDRSVRQGHFTRTGGGEVLKLGHKVKGHRSSVCETLCHAGQNDGNDARKGHRGNLMQPTIQFIAWQSPEQQDIEAYAGAGSVLSITALLRPRIVK